MLSKLFRKIKMTYKKADKKHLALILALMLFSGLMHGINMTKFPYLENDEATYISQAWSVATEGKLAPYTYWYDHAPAGWIFMAPWLFITTLFAGDDSLMMSGRVFMLILHVLSSLALYLITFKLTKKRSAGVLAVVLFSASPLAIYFQRRVLLDNIMIFWSLWSIYFALNATRLKYVILSATFAGIAVLTKESAVFLIPAILYIIFINSHKKQRKQALFLWLGVVSSIIAMYALAALLKGEFFPSGTWLGGNSEHVSLLETLKFHNSRGSFAFPWDKSGDFYRNFVEWYKKDVLIVIAGIISTVYCLIRGFKNRNFLIIGLIAFSFWIFLARGKLVIDFYVVPLIPLLSISIAAMFLDIIHLARRRKVIWILLAVMFIGVAGYYGSGNNTHFYKDEITNQENAVEWIQKNVPKDAVISMDDYAYPFLRSGEDYVNADWVWKIEKDPSINQKVGDWDNIEYILLTHEVLKQIKVGNFPMTKAALDHSILVADFTENSSSYINLDEYISTNGDWAQIYKVKNSNEIMLQDSWESYKANFIKSYGQVVDPQTQSTTSEGQSYAMLRAVSYGDRSSFDGLWQWTKDHMQHRTSDKLLSWKWQQLPDGTYQLADSNTATDADIDIAYALLQAYEQWNDEKYKTDALEIINDIWQKEIREINGKYVTLSSAEEQGPPYRINASYYSPYQFKLFSKYDSAHDWQKAASDSYVILIEIQKLSAKGLLSNWVYIDSTGKVSLSSIQDDTYYGYDAFRINWRLGLDLKNNKDVRARSILENINRFYDEQIIQPTDIYAVYNLTGVRAVDYVDIAPTSGVLINAQALDDAKVGTYANKYLQKQYNPETHFWGDPNNYYNQNWAWFAYDFQ